MNGPEKLFLTRTTIFGPRQGCWREIATIFELTRPYVDEMRLICLRCWEDIRKPIQSPLFFLSGACYSWFIIPDPITWSHTVELESPPVNDDQLEVYYTRWSSFNIREDDNITGSTSDSLIKETYIFESSRPRWMHSKQRERIPCTTPWECIEEFTRALMIRPSIDSTLSLHQIAFGQDIECPRFLTDVVCSVCGAESMSLVRGRCLVQSMRQL